MTDAVALRLEQPDSPEILALLAERDAHFYRSAGFEDGECFGEHLPNPLSIYLKKNL